MRFIIVFFWFLFWNCLVAAQETNKGYDKYKSAGIKLSQAGKFKPALANFKAAKAYSATSEIEALINQTEKRIQNKINNETPNKVAKKPVTREQKIKEDNLKQTVQPVVKTEEIFVQNGKYGLKEMGKIVIAPAYDTLMWINKSPGLLAGFVNKLYGVLSRDGRVLLEPKFDELVYEEAMPFIMIFIKDNVGIIDFGGNVIIEPVFAHIEIVGTYPDKGNLKLLRARTHSGLYGLFTFSGNSVLAVKYKYVDETAFDGRISFQQNEKFGYLDEKGFIVIPAEYSTSNYFEQGRAAVQKGGRFGYIDQFNNTIIPFIYEDAFSFQNDMAAVKLNAKWGFVDLDGKLAIPNIYTAVFNYSEEKAFVSKDELTNNISANRIHYGVINKYNRLILPYKYFQPSIIQNMEFKGGSAFVNIDETDGHDHKCDVNEKGEKLKEQ